MHHRWTTDVKGECMVFIRRGPDSFNLMCLPHLPVIYLDLISSDMIFTFDFPSVFHSTFDLPTISEAIRWKHSDAHLNPNPALFSESKAVQCAKMFYEARRRLACKLTGLSTNIFTENTCDLEPIMAQCNNATCFAASVKLHVLLLSRLFEMFVVRNANPLQGSTNLFHLNSPYTEQKQKADHYFIQWFCSLVFCQ